MRLLQGVRAGGGCAPPMRSMEALVKFLSKECEKNGLSTAYFLITPAVCMHRYRVNDLYQKITKQWSGYDQVGVLQL